MTNYHSMTSILIIIMVVSKFKVIIAARMEPAALIKQFLIIWGKDKMKRILILILLLTGLRRIILFMMTIKVKV